MFWYKNYQVDIEIIANKDIARNCAQACDIYGI